VARAHRGRQQACRKFDRQVRNIGRVTKAVALGDLSKRIDVGGEILDLKNTVNDMVVRLRALAAEVTRVVTLEVGSQGILGGQAHVPDVEGMWHRWYSPLFLSYVDFTFSFLLLT
jgi:hypothetical protein